MNRRALILPAAVSLAFVTAACGGGSGTTSATTSSAPAAAAPSSMASSMAPSMAPSGSMAPSESMAPSGSMAAASGPVGPGCAGYAAQVPSGAGSVSGMAQDPVAVAASNNPLLTTLVKAVSGKLNPKVNLVDTLNGGQFTVFAPVDSAFAKVPSATLGTLSKDATALTNLLTYHVVPGRLSPSEVVGMHKTVEGGTVTVTGTPEQLKVDGAGVICGGVSTANATVYLIDGVLMPMAK